MATAATMPATLSPPSAADAGDDQFAHIKYSITTTPPQPRRSLKPQTNGTSDSAKKPSASAPDNAKANAESKDGAHKAEDEHSKASSHTSSQPRHEDVDYSKEEGIQSRLHPSLRFIPEDKEHPPKEIVRSQPPASASEKSTAPTRSPSPSPPSSPAPPSSPNQSPSQSPIGGVRRVSQRQLKKAARAQAAQHSADDGDVQPDGAHVSKLKLLAPPPINSSRSGRRNSNSQSPSPTPSPSPPPSPYLSPDHPKRRNSFASAINSVLPVHDLMAELAPSKVSRHPYVLYPALFFAALAIAMAALGVSKTAPFSALAQLAQLLWRNLLLTSGVGALAVGAFAFRHRRRLVALYRGALLPPAGDSLPQPFAAEEIDLREERWQKKVAAWAEKVDEYSSVEEATRSASSPTDASPAPQDGAQSFDGISGRNALALMEVYQKGQLDDCTFVCLRIFLKDAAMNKTGDGDDTVAITFLSIKNHYDLSPYLLRLFTPIQACFPFLCAPALLSHTLRSWMSFRFGVIGFHWPFRQIVLFTKPLDAFSSYLQLQGRDMERFTSVTEEPMRIHIARYTSVLQLVRRFNSEQPADKRCHFMLFPVLSSSHVVDAVAASGGVAVPILPTYVVDLRKVKGGSWQDYKRHLRKMNRKVREGPFEGAGGNTEVTEGRDVSEAQAKTLVSLWWQVADYRGNKDQTACLMEPNPTYIQLLAHHPAAFIQMLQLKLKDTTVAASLLFSLSPALMTSDIAGFNYPALEAAGKEANQQIKAYPVKLAAVLKQAIASGYEWVDFGPTTGSSKMEIGAKEIPITGGIFFQSGLAVRVVLQVCIAAMSSQHAVVKKAMVE